MHVPFDAWTTLSRVGEIAWTRSGGRRAVDAAAAARGERLIAYARAHSPYYRDWWRAHGAVGAGLAALAPVTKRSLMDRFDDWVTDRQLRRSGVEAFLADRANIGEFYLGRYAIWKSSGSSGEPGIFVQDRGALATYDALLSAQLTSAAIAGRYVASLVMQGGRAALVAATGDHFASIASWERVCRGTPWPNARAFSVMEPMPALVAQLNAYRPAFLASYPTTLAMLAAEKRAGRLQITPSCIWSGGEYLADATRRAIERAFGAMLVNEYGASECMSIAFTCGRGALHVNADWVIVEPVDRDFRPTPPGERSHTVLLTNLANYVQPIIRYDLGDSVTAVAEPCACGSPLPVIRVEGRRDDVLSLRAGDGRLVQLAPLALTTVLEDALASRRFQLVQTGPSRIVVRLAAHDPRERSEAWPAARRALHAYLAQQGLGDVELYLDSIAPMPDAHSGKLREVLTTNPEAAAS
ncbi:MAG: phenylacetate--CoA ligase family protein [Proteobacteria bacterium]|nr:phenylacetate--CoA ligase family protein [Pseudomonadota bacterium]